MMNLIKQPFFLIGVSILALLFAVSAVYVELKPDPPEIELVVYNKEGKLMGKAPMPPSENHWLGTNQLGEDMFYKVMMGAKYTIMIALGLAMLRMVVSFIGCILLMNLPGRLRMFLVECAETFKFIPASLLAYIVLSPVIMIFFWTYTDAEYYALSIGILTMIAVPTISVALIGEVTEIKKMEFFISVKMMGGNKLHVLRKHIMPFLMPRILIMFGQQIVSSLLLLAHIGVLGLFIGGARWIKMDDLGRVKKPMLMRNEWSELVASSADYIWYAKWVLLAPLGGFVVVIFAANLMVEGMKRGLLLDHKKLKSKPIKEMNKGNETVEEKLFQLKKAE
ncbi:ABC transporter permease [Fictibacillus aquaticus]|uniref:ABC transmembrane type-1 domain-containing protein n=1 Tax=Fictibacillus aquaticus TaxID=2021314 RepID=A0A235F7D1_9BACL|nr:ABC transporter permease subunit [Fictibacillus aquaticus]OYD56595.1 hypothetical protein CGZ90_16415 [Fictibacillus aquaticus]